MHQECNDMAPWLNPTQAATNPEANNHATGHTEPTLNQARTKRRQGEPTLTQD
jgi:hypothetical protein